MFDIHLSNPVLPPGSPELLSFINNFCSCKLDFGDILDTTYELGALSNRLSSTIANLDNIAVNLSSARGRIQDTDFAEETSNLAKSQIMQQAATAMLAQANASKQTVLALIQ